MEQLLEQVPELKAKLRKRSETRTIHWSDVRENKSLREGDVIPVVSWTDDTGYQWTRADVMYHIKLHEAFDKPAPVQFCDRPTVKMSTVH